ncbi:MAG: Asparagine synthase (Glutamine-hydrolyzing) [Candidatus Sulfotelmatobacter sp.]|nr:Asparagine synthase (Glutamine-hydrolyzing) [Candidatus Sulfotelmatobacter sp.]
MCGIAGIVGSLSSDQVNGAIRAMLDAQLHRGPDDGGSTVISVGAGTVGLGNRRLAIQDLSLLGHQPMVNEAAGDILVYNGEIYNAPALRDWLKTDGVQFRGHSDTEVLLRAYERWGIECLSRLRGMFAFALWDARRSRLVIARDPMGIKPLYYAEKKDQWFVCASEVRALLQSKLLDSRIDRRSLAGYLAYGAVQEPLSIYEGIFSLPRGSWQERDVNGNVVAGGTYWQFPLPEQSQRNRPLRDVVDEGRGVLLESVRRHLLSDVRVGLFLSSGLDSIALLGLTPKKSNLEAFTVSFPDHPEYNETLAASVAATHFEVPYHDCPVSDSTALDWIGNALDSMDQPSMDGFNSYIVSRAVREKGIVVGLSGLGGDEVFGGYNLFRRVPRNYHAMTWISPLPESARTAAAWFATIFRNDIVRQKAYEIAKVNPGLIGLYFRHRRLIADSGLEAFGLRATDLNLSDDFQVPELQYQGCYVPGDLWSSVARLDAAFYLQNILLRDSDVFGMANALEIRVPFLDSDLMEWAFRLPGDVLLPKRAPLKYLLRQICSDVYARVPIASSKRGFVIPISEWLRGPLRAVAEESLSSLRDSGLLDPSGIDEVQELFRREPDSPAWSRLWALVTLGFWLGKRRSAPPAELAAGVDVHGL